MSLFPFNLDLAIFDAGLVRPYGERRGHAQDRAGAHVESRAMARALDGESFERSLAQRAIVMRAGVVDGEERAIDVA
jgi:hypothetical protein